MTTTAHVQERRGVPGAILGMIIFITSEVMFFGGLFAAYLSLRADAPAWPPEGVEVERALPIVLTVVLFASSYTVHLASAAARRGDGPGVLRALLLTVGLGLAFLGGQAFEYSRLGFEIGDGTFGSVFYATTGFHGLHVFIGVLILGLAAFQAGRRRLDARSAGQVEAAAYYWHFVDAVWVLVFTTIYVIQ